MTFRHKTVRRPRTGGRGEGVRRLKVARQRSKPCSQMTPAEWEAFRGGMQRRHPELGWENILQPRPATEADRAFARSIVLPD